MKEIHLVSGEIVQVSDEDWLYLMPFSWHLFKYVECPELGYMHQVVAKRMGLTGEQVDHTDRNKLNNQRSNLRAATNQQNHANRDTPSHNTSGYKGVSWDKNRKLWSAGIMYNGRRIFLGRFACPKQAAVAYNLKAKELFGEYAKLNEV